MAKYNREEILTTGIELLMTYGYSGLGIQQVLKVCGIPKGSFYNFFDSKDAFVLEVLSYYNLKIEEYLKALDKDVTKDSYGKVEAFFMKANESFQSEDYHLSCPMVNTVADGVNNRKILSLIHESFNMHKRYLNKWISQIPEKGAHNLEFLTHMIYDAYHGVVIRMRYEKSNEALTNFIDVFLPFHLK